MNSPLLGQEQPSSPPTPTQGNTNEETELQQIAEAIPTPTNLQPRNIWSNIFMATSTQTTTQVQPPTTFPMGSSTGKTTMGGNEPPGGGGGQGKLEPLNNPLGPPGSGNLGGGNPGGGGGNPGNPAGGGGNPALPHDKLSG